MLDCSFILFVLVAGVGAYSEVYQVTRKSDGIEYALKQVSRNVKGDENDSRVRVCAIGQDLKVDRKGEVECFERSQNSRFHQVSGSIHIHQT